MFLWRDEVIVWLRLIKPVCDLKLKTFGHYSFFFELQNDFVVLHLMHLNNKNRSNWFWNGQEMFLWNDEVIIWFRWIKPICDLKLKIFGHCYIVFEPQKYFVFLHLTHSKPQNSLKLVSKWIRYILLNWRGSLFNLNK
jgi:hypothetical protein